ncbi:LytTR family two component transcriptional regulator [Chitinophaga skermanii]|uniref:LytTR family two component transcriptional regulator n=1 Tax=Chitinophaga skermanii TaxID=331697 RepID=A0A327R2Q4_9BACT|nr:LytTR family DNA-binding domain-containing protein [Chitinophaga skermanii]RAJ11119.1 LytTR family two component transcriptional regulator [Chitinophaga skermanii]
MILRTIAIDDEPIALNIIQNFVGKVKGITLLAVFTDAFEAMDYVAKHPVDLIFLDIKMPDISGLDVSARVSKETMVIFTTAYTEHAVKSFELNAIDYLLKPFSLQRFEKACEKALYLQHLKREAFKEEAFIAVKSGYDQVRIPVTSIHYVQSAGNYVQFIGDKGKILSRMTMQEAEQLLPPAQFTRIHRSYIVAHKFVDKLDKNNVYIAHLALPVGSGYSEGLERIFNTNV